MTGRKILRGASAGNLEAELTQGEMKLAFVELVGLLIRTIPEVVVPLEGHKLIEERFEEERKRGAFPLCHPPTNFLDGAP